MRIFDVYMKFLIIFFLVHVALFLPVKSSLADVNFEKLYGSDLSMGVGARATGLGGAFVSISDDASAVYWNPAGLTDIPPTQSFSSFISMESPFSFSTAALVVSPPLDFLKAVNFKIGISHIRRLRFRGDSGKSEWNGYASHLLDLSMVDVGDHFSGKINSSTYDNRLSFAFAPFKNKNLSLGLNYIFLT
jgi:hypothetical protein